MANDVQISIKDRDSAMQWLSKVNLLNEEYHQAMTDAGQTLVDSKDFADGTMVDEFYNLGTNILGAAQKTFEAIGAIADVVTQTVSIVEQFTSGIVGIVKGLSGLIG